MKTILITGGSGFLGLHLSRYMITKGFRVIALDIEKGNFRELEDKITFIKADINDATALDKAFKKVDYVVHAAAALPILHAREPIFKTNVDGTRNVLKACLKNKIKRVIFISSTAVYGIPKRVPETEGDSISPIGHYGESKVVGEELCLEFYKKGLSVNIIRPKTFLGPERLGVFTLWFEAIYQGKGIFILGDGNNLYQLLDVEDLCDAIFNALIIKTDGEVFNVGASKFGTWRQDLGNLIKHAGSSSKIVGLPVVPSQILLSILEALNLSPIVAWHYKTFPINSYVSIEKAKKYLKFKPKKSNQKILEESYDWYKNNRKNLIGKTGNTHRTVWNFKLVDIIEKFV